MQQARIVYDHADAISHFTTQWAVYCFSTCLRVTPCHYSVELKAARREFVAILSGLLPNTKDIHLAPLVKEHGAKAINIPLSLNSYKPKPYAYVTFNSQATMDAAMEQTIGFQGRTLRWERFNIGQRPAQHRTPRTNSRSRSRSKSRDRSASAQHSNSNSNRSNNNDNNINNIKPSSSPGSVNSSSTAHGRAPSNNRKGKDRSVSFSQQLSAIEAHLGINPPSAPVVISEPDRMEEDPPETTGTLIPHPNAPLSSGPKKSTFPKSVLINASRSVPVSNSNPSPQDELNSVIQDQKAIKDTLQSLTGSIQGFIASFGGSPSDRASAPSH
ncbi:hypothetical protein GLOIN_2v1766278 [Rhizophagus irregularis DAOM 181602=DAOM 197198]|nr:hypothetical protein GLOIN_2v1766278 [Rhizophagus irregularis DAOM 181602=DAOM 197198]